MLHAGLIAVARSEEAMPMSSVDGVGSRSAGNLPPKYLFSHRRRAGKQVPKVVAGRN